MNRYYVVSTSTITRDGTVTADKEEPAYDTAQSAVDAARAFVTSYAGPDFARALVVRRYRPYRPPVIMFHAWRKLDGEYCEERVEKARTK